MIKETDRCKKIAALQNQFGGPGRAKFSPSTKYSPESIKLRTRTSYSNENGNAMVGGGGGGIGGISHEKKTMVRARSDNDCLSGTAFGEEKSGAAKGRARSYSAELLSETTVYFGEDVLSHEEATANRLSLRDHDGKGGGTLRRDAAAAREASRVSELLEADSSSAPSNAATTLGDIAPTKLYGSLATSGSTSKGGSPERRSVAAHLDEKMEGDTHRSKERRGATSLSQAVERGEEGGLSVDAGLRNEHLHIGSVSNIDISSPTNGLDFVLNEKKQQQDSVMFTQSEIMGLRLMFSLFDRCCLSLTLLC